jgi:hypothetical protein
MDLTDIYRIFHPTMAQYTFFSETHGTFSKTDHILGQKQASAKKENIKKTLHSIQSQCIKTRTQQQKQQKIHK